jgi:hypothetical protein
LCPTCAAILVLAEDHGDATYEDPWEAAFDCEDD